MLSVLCINGPNLDRLGERQPEVYGHRSLAELESQIVGWGRELGLEVTCSHSNHEGDLVEAVHSARDMAGVVLNPGALGHYSMSLRDAVASIDTPVVEVHISNVRGRSRWRRRTPITAVAAANVFGRGVEGYRAALRHLVNRRAVPFRTMRYGPHPDQVFDLRDGSQPVGVVLVHGGFWLDAWGRDTTEAWAVDLSAAGIPTANLEYRRLGSGGGRVTTVSDVSRALGEAIDHLGTERVIVVGHSAGAHLAIAAMTAHAAPGAASLAAIISVGGVLDLETALRADLGEGAVARFDPHAATSPLTSPPPPCQVVLVHGDHDGAVPAAQSRAYADYLDRLGADVSLHIVKGEGHFRALDPDSRTWQSVMAAIGGGDDR